jgi:hypothetical protein
MGGRQWRLFRLTAQTVADAAGQITIRRENPRGTAVN